MYRITLLFALLPAFINRRPGQEPISSSTLSGTQTPAGRFLAHVILNLDSAWTDLEEQRKDNTQLRKFLHSIFLT